MIKTFRFALAISVAGIAGSCERSPTGQVTATSQAPSTTVQPTAAWVPWTMAMPGSPWKVTVEHPAEWKVRTLDSGQPVLYLPGPWKDNRAPDWSFDVRTGSGTRSTAEVLEDFAGNFGRDGKSKVLEKKMETRPDGKTAGIVLWTVTLNGLPYTARDYFFQLDQTSILSITETSPTEQWEKVAPTLAAMTTSATVQPK